MATHDYSVTYDNVYHFTCESILLIIRDLMNGTIKDGDTVILPDYKLYPVGLIKRILPKVNIEIARIITKYIWPELDTDNSIRLTDAGKRRSIDYCDALSSFIIPDNLKHPNVVIRVRLGTRRWMPLSNTQELINKIKDKFNVYVIVHPKYDKALHVPDYDNAVVFVDPDYEKQLSIAASADYAISLCGGAGDVYTEMFKVPFIHIQPVVKSEMDETVIPKEYFKHCKIMDEGRHFMENNRITWWDDCNKITVDELLKEFEKMTGVQICQK